MALPKEDRPPSWLSDYGELHADIATMADFAAKLDAEVLNNYVPHLTRIYDDMTVEPPQPMKDFRELVAFMSTHQTAQQETANLVHIYPNATGRLAKAALSISKHYHGADVFSAARVDVVKAALNHSHMPQQPTQSEVA